MENQIRELFAHVNYLTNRILYYRCISETLNEARQDAEKIVEDVCKEIQIPKEKFRPCKESVDYALDQIRTAMEMEDPEPDWELAYEWTSANGTVYQITVQHDDDYNIGYTVEKGKYGQHVSYYHNGKGWSASNEYLFPVSTLFRRKLEIKYEVLIQEDPVKKEQIVQVMEKIGIMKLPCGETVREEVEEEIDIHLLEGANLPEILGRVERFQRLLLLYERFLEGKGKGLMLSFTDKDFAYTLDLEEPKRRDGSALAYLTLTESGLLVTMEPYTEEFLIYQYLNPEDYWEGSDLPVQSILIAKTDSLEEVLQFLIDWYKDREAQEGSQEYFVPLSERTAVLFPNPEDADDYYLYFRSGNPDEDLTESETAALENIREILKDARLQARDFLDD